MSTTAQRRGWRVPTVIDWTNALADPVPLILNACAQHRATGVYIPSLKHLPDGALARLRAHIAVFTTSPDHCYTVFAPHEGFHSE